MSNARMEFCSRNEVTTGCDAFSFMSRASSDSRVNHSQLVIVNGAHGGYVTSDWDSPSDDGYVVARDRLTTMGVTPRQVQVVWLKSADANPTGVLPSIDADAYRLEQGLGNVVRTLRTVYPNLRQVFISSRIYGGYANTTLNPEPYAYESGFSVKWVVTAQVSQMRNGTVDTLAGDLNYNTVAPWIGWGPYFWANGTSARSDGLTWVSGDFISDGTHPSQSGIMKTTSMLMAFFKTSPETRCWFVVNETCE